MIEVRKANIDFAGQLARLWRDIFVQNHKDRYSPEVIEAHCQANFTVEQAIAMLRLSGTRFALAYRDGKAVGFYLLRHVVCPVPVPGQSAELKQIYVLNSEFGQGTGRMLFDHARDRIAATGRSWLWLFVADTNTRARRFYNKLGFTPVGPGPICYIGTDPVPSTIMTRVA